LFSYVRFAREALAIEPPDTIEAGLTGIGGAYVAMPDRRRWGPIHEPELTHRVILDVPSPESRNSFLLDFFERIYELTGFTRPKGLYGFPPGRSSA
jgi:hypothetical protein